MRSFRRRLDLFTAGSGIDAIGDIRGNGVVEQRDLLADQRDIGAQAGQCDRTDVMPIEAYTS